MNLQYRNRGFAVVLLHGNDLVVSLMKKGFKISSYKVGVFLQIHIIYTYRN